MASERLPVVAVVDDDDEVRLAMVRLLSSAGYAAVGYLGQRPPACVLQAISEALSPGAVDAGSAGGGR
jgi:FixJ family two-component response regulator